MSDNKFKINSFKACKKNYDITDINNINQCCYDTLKAFEGEGFPQNQNCTDCITESKIAMGRDPCEFRLTGYPSWHQAPHYFPALLEQEGNVELAKNMCIKACKSNRYQGQCEQNCQVDSDAVETVENYAFNQKKHGKKQTDLEKIMSNDYVYKFVVISGMLLAIFFVTYITKKMN